MTEDEAKTKWCPVANTRFIPAGAGATASDRCIGSACMAWRETHMVTDAPVDPRDGYCGLAGKP